MVPSRRWLDRASRGDCGVCRTVTRERRSDISKTTSEAVSGLYIQNQQRFSSTDATGSPWAEGNQHGGPPLGLLAHLAREALGSDGEPFRPARLTVDLFRPVPRSPLASAAQVVRTGRRLALTEATLSGDDGAVARASALFLSREAGTARIGRTHGSADGARPPGPEGLETTGLLPETFRGGVPFGFHLVVEVRWTRWQERPAAWLRTPLELIAGRSSSPFERLAIVSDFANAVANLSRRQSASPAPPPIAFINVDTTLYLLREPVGEWFCLSAGDSLAWDGVANQRVAVFDAEGELGTVQQAALQQPRAPHQMGMRRPEQA